MSTRGESAVPGKKAEAEASAENCCILALMQGIEAVGSDLRFGPPGAGRIGCPSLLISKLVVSGK